MSVNAALSRQNGHFEISLEETHSVLHHTEVTESVFNVTQLQEAS